MFLRVESVVALALLVALPALAFEEPVRREEVDAGVHIPVLTKAPELLQFVQAAYPEEAQKKGLTASVKLLVTIGEDGSVTDAEVAERVGDGFDEAAVAAVKQFTFTPAEVDFKPAPVRIEYVYHFVLQEPDAGVPEPDAGPPIVKAHLKGELIARGSRSRIAGALVACINQPDVETNSDENGRFDLELNAGRCEVRVVAAEFEPFNTIETLEPNEVREVNYYVLPKVVGFETVVRGERDKKEVVRRTLSRQELQKIPGSFGDPVRVIQNFPGVARAPFISGQLIVRGASPSQTLTFFDGVDIPLLFHLAGGPSIVNGEFLDRIDFYPGGFGARYGRAVGGVIDVASRKGAADTLHGVVKVDLQDTALYLEAPITNGVSIAGAVRRSYIDALLPLVLPKDPQGGTILVLPVYWDYQVRLDVGGKRGMKETDNASTYSVFAFGSDDRLKVVATGGGRNRDVSVDLHTQFHRVVGGWSYRQGNTTFKLTPFLGYDLATIDLGITSGRVDQFRMGLRQDLQVEATPWLTVRAGADIFNQVLGGQIDIPTLDDTQYVGFPGADPKTEMQHITESIVTFDGAMYTEADFTVGKVTITPGLRMSHAFVNRQTRHAFDPRIWIRYAPLEGTTIKGSAGLYTQPPPGEDMEPPPFGTPTLTHEKAFQTSLGLSQKITENINFDLTGFYNRRFENISQPGPVTIDENNVVTDQRFGNQGMGRAYGLEFMLRHEVTRNFFGWLAYTFSRSEARRAGTPNDWALTQYDQTHILTLVASYRLPMGFEVGARFRYVTGNPKTPLIHDADFYSADRNSFSRTSGEFRSTRVPPFHQLDVRLDKYFTFEHWTLDVFLDVQNVYNQVNVEATFYDYRFRQEFNVPGIPLLPILGAKATF